MHQTIYTGRHSFTCCIQNHTLCLAIFCLIVQSRLTHHRANLNLVKLSHVKLRLYSLRPRVIKSIFGMPEPSLKCTAIIRVHLVSPFCPSQAVGIRSLDESPKVLSKLRSNKHCWEMEYKVVMDVQISMSRAACIKCNRQALL